MSLASSELGNLNCFFDRNKIIFQRRPFERTDLFLQLKFSVKIFGCVVIRVHLATKLRCYTKTIAHHFISLVLRHIDREEASMCLRERSIVHTAAQIDLMLVVEIRGINRKAATTPDELQVTRSLSIIECIKYAPESSNDLIRG